jgi:hypothetical protein
MAEREYVGLGVAGQARTATEILRPGMVPMRPDER